MMLARLLAVRLEARGSRPGISRRHNSGSDSLYEGGAGIAPGVLRSTIGGSVVRRPQQSRVWLAGCGVVLFLICATQSTPGLGAPPARPAFGISGDAATLAMLAKARVFIGPDATILAVKGFTIESSDPKASSFKVLLPDYYRDCSPTVTIVLGPGVFWQNSPFGVVGEANDGRQARFRRSFVRMCLNLLLRAPSAYPIQARPLGKQTVRSLSGHAVEFRFADGTTVEGVMLDPVSCRPLGAWWRDTTSQSGEGLTWVDRFEDYRETSGLRFPTQLRQERVLDDTSALRAAVAGVYRIARVVVDPPPSPEEFRKPTK
jgi:hypothetical protein